MGELQDYRLDEIAEVIDCEHKTAPRVEQSAFYSVRTPDILNGRINYANCYRVDQHTYELWTRRGKPEAGDIILAREAPVGEVGLIQPGYKVCLGQRTVLIKVNHELVDSSYLTFYLCAPPVKTELKEQSGGSVVAHLNMKDIRAFNVSLPDLPEQRAIASVLSSLDAKIDLLHRQNKTLEAMAEALFRQWFVERCPEFAEGEAKEGWMEYALTDVASHCKDSVNPGQHPTRIYHHYSLPAYDAGRKPSPELGDTIKSSKYVVPEYAVLISKLNPRFPRVWPVREKKHEHPISSTEFQVFVPKKDEMFGFLYCFLSSKAVQDELASAASGTSGSHQRVSPDDIKGLSFQAKSKQQIVDFSKVVDPLLKKIETNKDQVANLTKLRDTLLPKLMSGEVRVEQY